MAEDTKEVTKMSPAAFFVGLLIILLIASVVAAKVSLSWKSA